MKTMIKIQLAATLAVSLSMGGLGRSQTSEVSGQEDRKPSPETTPMSRVASAKPDPRTMPPTAAVFLYYCEIQEALAQDSLVDVAANALALAEVLRKNPAAGFPAQLANQAISLAADAVTIEGARLDFAIVSGLLMSYLQGRSAPVEVGPIHLVYDPVFTRLYWLQRGDSAQNPYLGNYGVNGKPLFSPSRPQQPLKINGY